jgi:hypothetical protein|tara:strand:+ start:1171 stop:1755 length:585 start_codon:yes stop_codon:yes gene_type:complete
MSVESDALIAAANAATALTVLAAQAITDLGTHEAEESKHTDWSVTGPEAIHTDRYIEGIDGDDGASAYALALAAGFVGSETAWLLTLKGADGAINLNQLAYSLRSTLRTPVTNPSTDDVIMIPNLGKFQFNATFDFVDDDETAFEVLDSSDGVTPIGQWIMTTPAHDWTEAQKMFYDAVLYEWMEDEQLRFNTY